METTSDGGANAINATSKPRGTYLDPLKACALSGESGVNIGKSESATYSKYMNIVRQTRRTASRVSVLNDVERSRLSSVMRRIDGEKAYSTAVMDRQKRQFKKSLESLDRHRSGLLRQIDEVVTPSHLRAKQSLLLTQRQQKLQTNKTAKDGGTKPSDGRPTNSVTGILPKNDGTESREKSVRRSGAGSELPALTTHPRTPHSPPARGGNEQPTVDRSGDAFESKGENVPVFYTGLGVDILQAQVQMVHTRKDVKREKPVTE